MSSQPKEYIFRTLSNIQDGVFCGFTPLIIFAKNSILDDWQGSEYASDINITRQIQYKILKEKIRTLRIQCKVFKGQTRTLRKKTEKKWFDERNSGTWIRILSFIYSWQGTEATARSIIMNETPALVFSS